MQEDILKNLEPLLGNHSLQEALMIFGLINARMLAVINMVPFLGSKNAPSQVKMGISILFSLIFYPLISEQVIATPDNLIVYFVFLLKEVFIGFSIGFVTAQIFYSVEMMGQIIDVMRGTNQAQLLVPELQERSSAFGDFNYQFLLVLFLTLGFHVPFFSVLADSFLKLPILANTPVSINSLAAIDFFARLLGDVFLIAVTLAFPIGLVCFLSDVAFGLLNRVAPQINAYFMSMPAKAAGGMMIFLAAFSMISEQFVYYSRVLLTLVSQAIDILL